jgi:hypothetical protein
MAQNHVQADRIIVEQTSPARSPSEFLLDYVTFGLQPGLLHNLDFHHNFGLSHNTQHPTPTLTTTTLAMPSFLRKVFFPKQRFDDPEPATNDTRAGDDDVTREHEQDERQRYWAERQHARQQREEEEMEIEMVPVPVLKDIDDVGGFDGDNTFDEDTTPNGDDYDDVDDDYDTFDSTETHETVAAAEKNVATAPPPLPVTTRIHGNGGGVLEAQTEHPYVVEGPNFGDNPSTPYGRKLAVEAWKKQQQDDMLRANGLGVLLNWPEHLNLGRDKIMEVTQPEKNLLFARARGAQAARLGGEGKRNREKPINEYSDEEDDYELIVSTRLRQ